MTKVIELPSGNALRCDRCRRLWPVGGDPADLGWYEDATADAHLCPTCRSAFGSHALADLAHADPRGWKPRLALSYLPPDLASP